MKSHGSQYIGPILFGLAVGVLARAASLGSDYRQFPSQPHGRIAYLFLGFVAALLGSLAMPALLTGDFTAGVFLALGTQQFHTVRSMERQMLGALDEEAPVPRGRAYIEGMAAAFEARNYLVVATSLTVTAAAIFLPAWLAALTAALAVATGRLCFRGGVLAEIADVRLAPVSEEAGWVAVGGLRVCEAPGVPGLGLWFAPRGLDERLTLSSTGQRQALLHDLSVRLGSRIAAGRPVLPREAVDPETGAVALFCAPLVDDADTVLAVARCVPVLEAVARRPLPAARRRSAGGS